MTEVLVAAVTGMFGLVAVLLPHLLRQNRKLNDVHEQVANSHQSNLRDDIDVIRNELRQGFGQMNYRLNLLHADLAHERQERIDLAERLESR